MEHGAYRDGRGIQVLDRRSHPFLSCQLSLSVYVCVFVCVCFGNERSSYVKYTKYPFTGHLSKSYYWSIVKCVFPRISKLLLSASGRLRRGERSEEIEKL